MQENEINNVQPMTVTGTAQFLKVAVVEDCFVVYSQEAMMSAPSRRGIEASETPEGSLWYGISDR